MDGTMCMDMKCPMKTSCYRHTAPWNQWRQSIFAESPREEGKFYCEKFWDNTGHTLDEKFKEYEKIKYGKVHKSLSRKKKSTKKEASS
jgi:hypothetical protein